MILLFAPVSMLPHVGVGSGTPNPRYESVDSVSIAVPNASVIDTRHTDITLGMMCLNMILDSFTPTVLAAVTYSISLCASI